MPPDDYVNTLEQAWSIAVPQMTALENVNTGDFNDGIKCNILKSKIGGKFAPVPANDPFIQGNPAINIPDILRVYLNAKYQRETVGSQQSAIQKLTQEKFQINDTPDIYETRIRPLVLGTANNDEQVLGFLKNHLPGKLYTWMKIANPTGIDEFFTALKNMWLERTPNLNEGKVYQQSSYSPKIIEAPVISQSPDTQKMIDEALAKQKSNYDIEIEKLRKEVQSSKVQKTQALVPQTVEPVRQPRGPPSNLKTDKDYEDYYVAKYFNDLGIYSKEDLDSHYPKKPFQRTNQSAKMDRIESKVDEIGQMTSQFGKMILKNQSKKPVAKSNRTQ
ncbi:9095_t:CDS:1 [Diversispora eburnea]|uniref:9095_t:CDS:1 n=1 Tax=Diversispora eburnea TaxID=1213867 RepID=A0A9N9CIR1_9GLOM|nr:9095_t:CDS:1 [Diversispora eburnea]